MSSAVNAEKSNKRAMIYFYELYLNFRILGIHVENSHVLRHTKYKSLLYYIRQNVQMQVLIPKKEQELKKMQFFNNHKRKK